MALEEQQIRRIYRLYSPVYDLVLGPVFHRSRAAAIRCAEIRPGDRVLEVGVGTGLNLAHYPRDCEVVGIDISPEMLAKAENRIDRLGMSNVTVQVMDAARLEFPDDSFDRAVAIQTVSAVARPAEVLKEMSRVVKPDGCFVVTNYFRSERPLQGKFEDLVAPVCRRLGWQSNLALRPLLAEAALRPDLIQRINLFGAWHLLRFRNGDHADRAA